MYQFIFQIDLESSLLITKNGNFYLKKYCFGNLKIFRFGVIKQFIFSSLHFNALISDQKNYMHIWTCFSHFYCVTDFYISMLAPTISQDPQNSIGIF